MVLLAWLHLGVALNATRVCLTSLWRSSRCLKRREFHLYLFETMHNNRALSLFNTKNILAFSAAIVTQLAGAATISFQRAALEDPIGVSITSTVPTGATSSNAVAPDAGGGGAAQRPQALSATASDVSRLKVFNDATDGGGIGSQC